MFHNRKAPNNVCSGQVGTRRVFKRFRGFEFFRFDRESHPAHLPLTRAVGKNKMAKQFILISLLVILISACNQQVTTLTPSPEEVQSTKPVPLNTAESTTTALPDLATTEKALPHITFPPTITPVDTATAAFSLCPGAPGPYAAIGKQVTVVAEDIDKLQLRSEPTISPNTVLRELNRFTQMYIVGGPVCVHSTETGSSYWFWQVKVDREIGWVAEGDAQHSFITVSVGLQNIQTATAYTATTLSACPSAHPGYPAGTEVTVTVGGADKLKLRSKPKISPDTVIRELDQFTKLKIVGGTICVTSAETGMSYWLWKVKVISSGETGWVAEGDGQSYFIEAIGPP